MLPGANYIEILNENIERGRIRFALFDFDGTISLIRQGWQDVMIPMMVEILAELNTGETEEELYAVVRDFVTRLTGKQTIYQMIELARQIELRGGKPRDPLDYKHEYLRRLWERIEDRVKGLKEGRYTPEQMSVPGSLDMVRMLRERGVELYLASGTDLPYVLDEARCLGVDRYFGGNIYGALDDYKRFSKAMLIQRIITEHNLTGPEFVAFGDGFVEIENAKEVGGIAVGVASDEVRREGIDDWKRNRLIEAGADLIIPDFRERDRLV
ncbi:MAG: HAD family hydrolase, partial [Armatimonadetes bacterium]|nr:HAD family hydrolase [Armatimonadota bacterium]